MADWGRLSPLTLEGLYINTLGYASQQSSSICLTRQIKLYVRSSNVYQGKDVTFYTIYFDYRLSGFGIGVWIYSVLE